MTPALPPSTPPKAPAASAKTSGSSEKPLFNFDFRAPLAPGATTTTPTGSTPGSSSQRPLPPSTFSFTKDKPHNTSAAHASPAVSSPASSLFTTPSHTPQRAATITPQGTFLFGNTSPAQANQSLFGRAADSPATSTSTGTSTPAGRSDFLFGRPVTNPFSALSPIPTGTRDGPSLSSEMGSLSLGSSAQTSGLASVGVSQTPTPYNILDELPPAHEFFSSTVQEALRNARQIVGQIQQSLDEASQEFPQDTELTDLSSAASLTSVQQSSRARTVAILGDSGQGKSSLINSLLHLPGIAHTSDGGSACTSVVTEYHQKGRNQSSPINIEVEYYSGADLEELVKELAWSYRQLYLPDTQNAELTTDRQYAKYQRESDEACSALQSAFQHHGGFSAAFLRDASDGALDRINQQLFQWAREIKWPTGGNARTLQGSTLATLTASSAEECCKKTRVFMEDGLWPFTKVIRVYLSSPVLDSGVILADLPGLHDTNLARVKATQTYLLGCDKILIVSRIARAITDQSVRSAIYTALARHVPMEWEQSGGKGLKLAVVCTGAEDINIKSAMTEFVGQGKRVSPAEMERLEAGVQDAKTLNKREEKKAAKRRLEFALISARMAHVTEALQSRYSADTGGHLDVFCVANQAYEKYCRKGNAEFVKISGIPSLRQFCRTIAVDDGLLQARHLLQSQVPSLLNSMDLWASSRIAHGAFDSVDKSNMLEHLENIQTQVPEYVVQLRESFVDCFEEQVLAGWAPNEDGWKTAAVDKSQEWAKWRWNSYNAWCRRNGKHSTPTHGKVDWNSLIIWKMRVDLGYQWGIVEEEIPTVFEKLIENLSRELTWFKDDTIMEASATTHRQLLLDSIDVIDRLWKYDVKLEEQKLARGLAQIRKRTTESNETSYILGEMLSTYRTASTHSGKGIFDRQRAEIGGHLGRNPVFSNIAIRMMEDVEALAKETEDTVGLLVTQMMKRLEHDVRMVLKEGDRDQGSENSATRLKKAVEGFKARLEGVPKF